MPDIRLEIGGVDLTGNLMEQTLAVTEELNLRGDAIFSLTSPTGNLHVAVGAVVRLMYRGIVIFAGTVDRFTEHVPDNTSVIFIEVSVVDFSQILDRHIVNVVFQAGMTVREIVSAIVSTYSGAEGETLAAEGIVFTSQTVEEGPTLGKIVFKNQRASECLDKLCEVVGFAWWVDQFWVLHVRDSATNKAPQPLNEVIHANYGNVRYEKSREGYRNIQFLEAGKTTTAPITDANARVETFVADGEATTYSLALPLAAKPKIEIDVGAGFVVVASSKISPKELDEDADWEYQIDQNSVSQNPSDAAPKLAVGNRVRVTYQGYFPILSQARDDAEIARRRTAEGGTGVYVRVDSDQDVDDFDLAVERTSGLLRRFSRLPERVSCKTTTHGYHPGQLVPVVSPEHRIFAEYLIDRVSFRFLGWDEDEPFAYEISAVSGESFGSWADWYRRLNDTVRPFTISENEQIHILQHFEEKLRASDTLHVEDGDTRITLFENFLTFWVIPLSSIGSQHEEEPGAPDGSGWVAGPVIGMELIP